MVLLLLLAGGSGCAGRHQTRITILHTNDLHGHILPGRIADREAKTGGYAVFASWVERVREANRRRGIPTLLLDGGDIFMGTPEGNLTRGAGVVELMNAVGYDALAIGNHEFDYGYENLEDLAGLARFPFLSANIHLLGSEAPAGFIRPFAIREYPGLTVALVGLTTQETGVIALPRHVAELAFGEPREAIRNLLPLFEDLGVDLLVAVSHLGREADGELARAVPEIDVIVGGHSHELIRRPGREAGGRALICQAGAYGRHAGRLDLLVDTRRGRVVHHRYRLFTNREGAIRPDPEIELLLEKITGETGAELKRKVGTALADLESSGDRESGLGNLLADAIRESAGTETAFHNAFGIRAPILKGPVTMRDLYLVMPFDNTIVTMELTGRQLREILEQSLTLKKGMLQVSGLRAEYSLKRPEGDRLLSLEIGGEAAREEAVYTAAVNGFLAEGGDYFTTFTAGAAATDTGIAVREALVNAVEARSPLPPSSRPERLIERR